MKKDCKVKYLAYSLLQNVGQAHEEVENHKYVFYRRDHVECGDEINDVIKKNDYMFKFFRLFFSPFAMIEEEQQSKYRSGWKSYCGEFWDFTGLIPFIVPPDQAIRSPVGIISPIQVSGIIFN